MKYECECIKNIEWFKSYKNFIQPKQTTDLASLSLVMVNLIDETMNFSDEVWMWVHQKCGIIQIVKKLYSIESNNCYYLIVSEDGQFNWRNNKCEWWSMNVRASKIWNESNPKNILFNWNKQLISPVCSWIWSIESMKQWMWLMKYECECIVINRRWGNNY